MQKPVGLPLRRRHGTHFIATDANGVIWFGVCCFYWEAEGTFAPMPQARFVFGLRHVSESRLDGVEYEYREAEYEYEYEKIVLVLRRSPVLVLLLEPRADEHWAIGQKQRWRDVLPDAEGEAFGDDRCNFLVRVRCSDWMVSSTSTAKLSTSIGPFRLKAAIQTPQPLLSETQGPGGRVHFGWMLAGH